MSTSTEFYLFHLMPYADLDLEASKDFPTVWATLPNSFYDPQKGHALYNRYLDELEYGERLGFDGLCVNEHHQTAYGLMPSPRHGLMDITDQGRAGLEALWAARSAMRLALQ